PGGKQFDTKTARQIAQSIKDLVIIAGRYEGIDERVNKVFKTEKISVGPYVLTGGELPALILVDSISRQIEGVLGNDLSLEERRISSNKVYTRPEIFKIKDKNYRVPKVLLSGDHKKINMWKNAGNK
ncbi:MAG TPA: tRNA (guanosine(37)-N1)-methyltransferase TrmD, partial [Candidatus Paceibacterota bacterium]|nr:tRNA (guanosine(37)-N1)-methyltransferase TrmD [Candidatus Paceibacterota bacterium]